MWKLGIGVYFLLLSLPCIAASCSSLVQQQIATDLQASELFPSETNTFVVVLCKTAQPALYETFFAYLHTADQHKHNAPTAGLSRSQQAVQPSDKSRTTGVVVASTNKAQEYTLQTRTRMTSGEAIDITTTLQLARRESKVFVKRGITLGIARL